MNAQTRLSAKGQLVVPKAVRDRLAWQAGDALEIVEHDGAITLRAAPRPSQGLTAVEAMAILRAELPYTGPPVADDEIDAATAAMARRDGDY